MDKASRKFQSWGYLLLGCRYVLWLHQATDVKSLNVYKIFNFSGVSKIIQAIQNDKQPNESIDYFTPEWNLLHMRQNFPNSEHPLDAPSQLSKMLSLAKRLSGDLPFVRTDFYQVNGQIYFSEYTFYSDAGMARFTPTEWDNTLGDWIKLPSQKEKKETKK